MSAQFIRPATAFSVSRQRRPRVKADSHLAFIRSLPSLIPSVEPVEAAHIRMGDRRYGKPETGLGEKPDDKWCVPLGADRHREQHGMNEREFWQQHGIDPILIAALLWAHTGQEERARHVIAWAQGNMRTKDTP